MTLLDLLRQELPKRGGWPEGTDFTVQDGDGTNDIKFGAGEPSVQYDCDRVWRNTELSDWGIDTSESYIRDITVLADDHSTAIVTREQYEATGWDGTNLPPVGCLVEVNSPRYGWTQATVTAVTGSWIIAKYPDGAEYAGCHRCLNGDGSWTDNSGIFRPLRTEAERAIDEMVRLSGVSIGAAKILYDAGYRK